MGRAIAKAPDTPDKPCRLRPLSLGVDQVAVLSRIRIGAEKTSKSESPLSSCSASCSCFTGSCQKGTWRLAAQGPGSFRLSLGIGKRPRRECQVSLTLDHVGLPQRADGFGSGLHFEGCPFMLDKSTTDGLPLLLTNLHILPLGRWHGRFYWQAARKGSSPGWLWEVK